MALSTSNTNQQKQNRLKQRVVQQANNAPAYNPAATSVTAKLKANSAPITDEADLLGPLGDAKPVPLSVQNPKPDMTPKQVTQKFTQGSTPVTKEQDLLGPLGYAATVTRADGTQQQYTRDQLSKMAANVNTVNLNPLSKGVMANAQNDNNRNNLGDIRQKLREKVLAGGIGSRAALTGLLELDKSDVSRLNNQDDNFTSDLNNQRTNMVAAERLGLDITKENRAVRGEYADAATKYFDTMFEESERDSPKYRQLNSLTNEIGTTLNVDQSAIPAIARFSDLMLETVENAGYFFEGPFDLQTMSQIKNLTLDTEAGEITFSDASGKEYTTEVGGGWLWDNDLSAREGGEFASIAKQLGINFNVK